MRFLKGVAHWQTMVALAAPLLIVAMLLWQHPYQNVPVAAEPRGLPVAPPEGVSAEEWDEALTELDVVNDGTMQCAAEEMPAYWRLLKWAGGESVGDSKQQAAPQISLRDLFKRPDASRGRSVRVNLHVRRIAACAAPKNSLGVENLYEVWGWCESAPDSLVACITAELPPGIEPGEYVEERATLCGYFYKFQGYRTAGSNAQSVASAPLIIGRLSPWQQPMTVVAKGNDWWFAAAGLLLAVSFAGLLVRRSLTRSRESVEQPPLVATTKLEDWLDARRPPDLADESFLFERAGQGTNGSPSTRPLARPSHQLDYSATSS